MEDIKKIREKVYQLLNNAKGSHHFDHTERVLNMALHIGKKENADLKILTLASYLHDIKREEEMNQKGTFCHAKEGAIEAKKILKEIGLSEKIQEEVAHCIDTHRFRNNKEPITKEAKILFDADKLDSIGAIGIGRTFLFAGEIGAILHSNEWSQEFTYTKKDTAYNEYMVKLRHIKDKMLTTEGKKIAVERHKFMETFFKKLKNEIKGNE